MGRGRYIQLGSEVIEEAREARYLKVTVPRHSHEYFQNQISHTGVTTRTTRLSEKGRGGRGTSAAESAAAGVIPCAEDPSTDHAATSQHRSGSRRIRTLQRVEANLTSASVSAAAASPMLISGSHSCPR